MMCSAIPGICASLASLCLSFPALAEPPLTEDVFFAPMPTVLTAIRVRQPLTDVPVAMTVIDRAIIEASTASSVVDLLRSQRQPC